MISEAQQDQAALYALDLLGAEEASAFEGELSGNTELQVLVRELRDAAGSVALAAPQNIAPPAALKQRVMQQIAAEATDTSGKIVRFPQWIPWAIAAALAIFCGILALDRAKLQQQRAEVSTPVLVSLAAAEGAPAKGDGVVAWEPAKQTGVIKLRNVAALQRDQDYQLWVVDSEHKDPVDAGIVRVDANGVAQVQFKPKETVGQVKAFALSLERAGGVPKREGPILLIGSV